MTEKPRITIDAPNGTVILAARHLDPTEGPVRIGTTVDPDTRSAITTVLRYISKAYNAPAAAAPDAATPGTPPQGPAGASSTNTERDRYARLAEDRAEHITRLTAEREQLRKRLAWQEAETMRQHERAENTEATLDGTAPPTDVPAADRTYASIRLTDAGKKAAEQAGRTS